MSLIAVVLLFFYYRLKQELQNRSYILTLLLQISHKLTNNPRSVMIASNNKQYNDSI